VDAALVIAFYALVVALALKIRRFNLALATLVLTLVLVLALVVQATVSERVGGWAALVLTSGVVMLALAARLAAWTSDSDDEDAEGDATVE